MWGYILYGHPHNIWSSSDPLVPWPMYGHLEYSSFTPLLSQEEALERGPPRWVRQTLRGLSQAEGK